MNRPNPFKSTVSLILNFTLMLVISGCNKTQNQISNKDSFIITGKLDFPGYDDFIYLKYADSIVDSVKVINGEFEFKGHVKKTTQGSMNLQYPSSVYWIYVENSPINLELTGKLMEIEGRKIHYIKEKKISGSKSAEIQKEFKTFYDENKHKDSFNILLFGMLKEYVKENSKHPFVGQLLAGIAGNSKDLNADQLLKLYALTDTTFYNPSELKTFHEGVKNLQKYGKGMPFYPFVLADYKGNTMRLDDFSGKLLIVDFWASWCGPCVEIHQQLTEVKKKYPTQNYEIISISIDENKENWLMSLKDNNYYDWKNFWDENSQLFKELNLNYLPHLLLIDKDGIILEPYATMQKIEEQIKML